MWTTDHQNEKVFQSLLNLAQDAELIQSSRHAAGVVWKNRILATGTAKLKSHPIQVQFQPNKKRIYLHAEIDAIIRTINLHGSSMLSECELYVLRLSKGGKVSLSKPCEGCQRAIEAFNLKKVYWT